MIVTDKTEYNNSNKNILNRDDYHDDNIGN